MSVARSAILDAQDSALVLLTLILSRTPALVATAATNLCWAESVPRIHAFGDRERECCLTTGTTVGSVRNQAWPSMAKLPDAFLAHLASLASLVGSMHQPCWKRAALLY